MKVRATLSTIPNGETLSYSGLAERIGQPTAVRAVGLANGANPVSVVASCHRVIGSDGSLTGYSGGYPGSSGCLNTRGLSRKPDG
jgi:methylated-DNA-[protein]-cysteine S-methyltransferase